MKRIFGSLDPFLEYGDVMGRKVANTSFLHALLCGGHFDEYHFYLPGERESRTFLEQVRKSFPDHAGAVQARLRRDLPAGLASNGYHAFHLSDCITSQPQLARLRNLYSERMFPITGVTHSLSYAHYGQSFLSHLWPGATPRDCIVSTSRTGQAVVEQYFAGLRRGYQLTEETHPGPSLRRVPLAVDTENIRPAEAQDKKSARGRLGLDSSRTVMLVFGRLSHYSKMDLLPLLRAIARMQEQDPGSENPVLVLAGWTEEGEQYHEAVAGLAASLGVEAKVFVRPDEERKRELFHAADLFVSIADNPQETFGITIIEAMAAGLPVVASEYDGYRDLVRHEETGLLVPTLSPQSTPEVDALAPLLFDSDSHLMLAQETVVDVPALAEALGRLHVSPELRGQLGRAGRVRAEERYSWRRVMQDYFALWDELWTLPAERRTESHPMEVRYGETFGHYTTENYSPDMRVRQSKLGGQVYQGKALPVIYPGIAHLVDQEQLQKALFAARKPVPLGELAARVKEMHADNTDEARVRFLLAWALKHDYLERAS